MLAATRIRRVVPSSKRTRTLRKFGIKRRFVLLLAWLTLLPTIGPLPVIAHTFDISYPFDKLKAGFYLNELKFALIVTFYNTSAS